MSVSFNARSSVTKFTLLNDQGDVLNGFYMEITAFPSGSNLGQATYVDARGTQDRIMFKYNEEKKIFDSWHVTTPTNNMSDLTEPFIMKPVIAGVNIVGLDVKFDDIDDFVAHFALDIPSPEGDMDMV